MIEEWSENEIMKRTENEEQKRIPISLKQA